MALNVAATLTRYVYQLEEYHVTAMTEHPHKQREFGISQPPGILGGTNSLTHQEALTMSRLDLFCDVDDFWQSYGPDWEHLLLSSGAKKRHRDSAMSPDLALS